MSLSDHEGDLVSNVNFLLCKALFKDFCVIMYCLILNSNDLRCQQWKEMLQ